VRGISADGPGRPSLHHLPLLSCSFLATAAAIRRGAKRTDCASSQFLNPEITVGLPAINAR
jgi:hypothetical protein